MTFSSLTLDPAVSLAVTLRGNMHHNEMIQYMISQIVGGILGGLCGGIVSSSYSVVAMGDDASYLQALLAEFVFTFILCFVILSVATNPKVENNQYYGLAIGLVVASGAISVGNISGGAFNPAVVFGLNLTAGFSNLGYGCVVALSNLIGGVAAAGCFRIVISEDEEPSGSAGERTPLNA